MTSVAKRVLIVGAGPAGLTAAYLLSQQGLKVTVLEADPQDVGGISRTIQYKGYRFDIGGHRFFSKSKEVEALWTELLPNDMLERPRSSRIFYKGKFFSYPLKAFEALFKLGIYESFLCLFSYAWARLFPVKNPKSFKDWVSNQFGARLFSIFFKSYTEKVWGMSCEEISADWAAQRIKGLSLSSAIFNALRPAKKGTHGVIKTLIDSFRYPRKGPGMMWEACAEQVRVRGGQVLLGHKVVRISQEGGANGWKLTAIGPSGVSQEFLADEIISSMPMRELGNALKERLSSEAVEASKALKYRDFLTVALIVKSPEAFADNWLYIHDPSVKVGRIQNYRSWSPEMIPNDTHSCYGLEYFCFEGDGLWARSDDALIELAKKELAQLGICGPEEVVDGHVVRQSKAYPVYDEVYQRHVRTIAEEFEEKFPTLHLVGRNGMHKYNNQDHAMMTAMLCAKNICEGRRIYDLWAVNEDAEYHEAGRAGTQDLGTGLRAVPGRILNSEKKTAA